MRCTRSGAKTLADALGGDLTEKGQSGFPQGYSRASERGDPMQVEAGGSGKQAEIDRDRDRYFREVDRAIIEHHSRASGLPLILAALPEQQPHFRRISHNENLLPEGIEIGQSTLSLQELREKSWMVMQPRYLKRLEGLLDQFGASHGQGLASDQLEDIGGPRVRAASRRFWWKPSGEPGTSTVTMARPQRPTRMRSTRRTCSTN